MNRHEEQSIDLRCLRGFDVGEGRKILLGINRPWLMVPEDLTALIQPLVPTHAWGQEIQLIKKGVLKCLLFPLDVNYS